MSVCVYMCVSYSVQTIIFRLWNGMRFCQQSFSSNADAAVRVVFAVLFQLYVVLFKIVAEMQSTNRMYI